MRSIRTLLVFPPFGNHTHPYLSIPALAAFLEAAGKDVQCWDLNLDFYDVFFSRPTAEVCHRRYLERFEQIRNMQEVCAVEEQVFRDGARGLRMTDMLFQQIDQIRNGARRNMTGQAVMEGQRLPYVWGRLLQEYTRAAYFPFPESTVEFGDVGNPMYHHQSYHLGSSSQLYEAAHDVESIVNIVYDQMDFSRLTELRPDVIGLSMPFGHNVLPALKFAIRARRLLPNVHIVMGGGYPSCHWRTMSSAARLFDIFDSVVIDDGEEPLLALVNSLENGGSMDDVPNLIYRDQAGTVCHNRIRPADRIDDRPAPTFKDYELDRYYTSPNGHHHQLHLPLILAHGCYWRKCTFCDIHLQYVADYQNQSVDSILTKIRQMVDQTGLCHFHFVDEAAPPALLRKLSERLIAEGPEIYWHTNIRFEKAYDAELADLMARAGCWAIEGGVEVAVDRVLALIDKGTTRKQVVDAARNLTAAGIRVRGYFMIGFPTETREEAFAALDFVQTCFREQLLKGGTYHHFIITRGAPAFHDPASLGITKMNPKPELDLWDTINDFETESGMTTVESRQLTRIFNTLVRGFQFGQYVDQPVKQLVEIYSDPDGGIPYLSNAAEIALIDHSSITDSGLAHISRNRVVTSLTLSGCRQLTDNGLSVLADLRSLRKLDLTLNGQLTDRAVDTIGNLTWLKSLALSWCRGITPNGVSKLNQLNELEWLDLSGVDGVNDCSLSSIAQLPALQVLILRECNQITDVGVGMLGSMRRIRVINLLGCQKVSQIGLSQVKARLPSCQVVSA